MNQNKSNGSEMKKNGMEETRNSTQQNYYDVLDKLRKTALAKPQFNRFTPSSNHQLFQFDGMYFFQLGIGLIYDNLIEKDEIKFKKYPFWYVETVLIRKQNGQFTPTPLKSTLLIKPKLIKHIRKVLDDAVQYKGVDKETCLLETNYGYQLKRPLTLAEFQKLTPKAKQFSDYKEEK